MTTHTSRLRQIGWLVLLGACLAAFLALTFKVNAVKSDVRLVERQIIAAERAKQMLETEFQTRANQHQLADWNRVEFGYSAPRADQYLEQERQLAVLGTPRGIGAPQPIRVAMADAGESEEEGLFDEWLGSDDAKQVAVVQPAEPSRRLASSLAQRLAQPARVSVAAAEVGQ
ncbi:hypothetical protein K3163_10890 [Qipengyuania sp. 1NDW9]|uniref:Uncharacterized protein n=2 Tax=Qipengyuania TaxID=1855416 RepID=A0A9Q3XBD1_9SPHN|nr:MULTISPECIES: hypothetical protein [Qipengyuania]MBX7493715.1 hypothetical protein [Qipengyuania xiapuensis]MBY6217117.1 hypothetical protein [Qipengyuania aquimaris]QZD92180.1 hypothetical protein K3162_11635 [Qipengyuania xiapuensis]UOR14263.1 hypothetical protein LCM05_07040 [Qipengyuania aquimaris]